jgi:prepilin-type N-terminal cleavage/methylation domain-containing protein
MRGNTPGLNMDSHRLISSQEGFTIIEMLVGIVMIAVGLLAVIGTLDASRRLVSVSERKEAAVHQAQQEIERLQARDYDSIALNAAPPTDSDPESPLSYVTSGSPPRYRWNRNEGATATEELAIDAEKGVSPAPTPWTDGRLSGQLYRFVTWVDDPGCAELLCPGSRDYKRITVAVTIDGDAAPNRPILLSSLASDPDSGPLEGVTDGVANVLESPDTQCLEGGVWVECAGSTLANTTTWFAYDTPAPSSDVRQSITGDHPLHRTVALLDTLTCNALITTGCPEPDLLGQAPPPAPPEGDPLPALFDYSTDLTGGRIGGRALIRDVSCASTPSADNTKGHMWVTPPLDDPMTLTGNGGITLHTQTIDGVTAGATLCVRVYDVPNSLLNLIALPPTPLGDAAAYALGSWPATASPVSFNFDVLTSNVTVPAGHRVGLRIWAAGSSGADLAVIYDHPSYPSSVQLNSL